MHQYYTIADIESILFNASTPFLLPEHVSNIIKKLEDELQINELPEPTASVHKKPDKSYESKPHFIKKIDPRYSKNNNMKKSSAEEDWETIRNFKTTKMDVIEGADKAINNIRVLFNKISPKNYATQSIIISDAIQEFLTNHETALDATDVHITKLSKIIFDIVSTNKFFSELYADLYKELMNKFDIFNTILMNNILDFKHTIDSIHYVDPNTDYDGYCQYTKINDNRKALTMFIINMYKKGTLSKDVIFEILNYFLSKSVQYFEEPGKSNETEEITENIFIIISNAQSNLAKEPEWQDTILPMIISISQMKTRDHISLTNRVVFKYMDIIDSLD